MIAVLFCILLQLLLCFPIKNSPFIIYRLFLYYYHYVFTKYNYHYHYYSFQIRHLFTMYSFLLLLEIFYNLLLSQFNSIHCHICKLYIHIFLLITIYNFLFIFWHLFIFFLSTSLCFQDLLCVDARWWAWLPCRHHRPHWPCGRWKATGTWHWPTLSRGDNQGGRRMGYRSDWYLSTQPIVGWWLVVGGLLF